MTFSALAQSTLSQLVIVDVQERLCTSMEANALQALKRNCSILLQAARLLSVPTLCTEQYPKGLGHTLPELTQWIDPGSAIEKTCFSCCENQSFRVRLDAGKPQIVLVGMEAHICILQTALQLLAMGKQVFVVEDAVLSRSPANKANALERLRHVGAIVTNTESVVFEWLKIAEGDAFKQISKLVR